jgi:predicted DNA-binding transcriptional regulator AlpA
MIAEPTSTLGKDEAAGEPAIASLVGALNSMLSRAPNGAPPETLSVDEAAAFLGISRTSLWRLDDNGLCPKALPLAGKRWLRLELLAWLCAGAPRRSEWQQVRDTWLKAAMRRA